MHRRLAGLLTLSALLLAACTGPYPSDILRDPVLGSYPQPAITYLVFDPAQGFRVEHFGAGGEAQLWAPGAAVLHGRWRLVDRHRIREMGLYMRRAGEELCLYFGQRHQGALSDADWDCRPRLRTADAAVAMLRGDVFGLANRRDPPFPLERCRPPPVFDLVVAVGC